MADGLIQGSASRRSARSGRPLLRVKTLSGRGSPHLSSARPTTKFRLGPRRDVSCGIRRSTQEESPRRACATLRYMGARNFNISTWVISLLLSPLAVVSSSNHQPRRRPFRTPRPSRSTLKCSEASSPPRSTACAERLGGEARPQLMSALGEGWPLRHSGTMPSSLECFFLEAQVQQKC